jgi:hypothetical protein
MNRFFDLDPHDCAIGGGLLAVGGGIAALSVPWAFITVGTIVFLMGLRGLLRTPGGR